MKKISKQIIALLLAIVMVLPIGMFSVNPFATKARAEETQQDLQNNVEYKATNALGANTLTTQFLITDTILRV